jgi:hypothetical protein
MILMKCDIVISNNNFNYCTCIWKCYIFQSKSYMGMNILYSGIMLFSFKFPSSISLKIKIMGAL